MAIRWFPMNGSFSVPEQAGELDHQALIAKLRGRSDRISAVGVDYVEITARTVLPAEPDICRQGIALSVVLDDGTDIGTG